MDEERAAPLEDLGCRSCGARGLERIVWLGRVPLANALLGPEELRQPEPRWPLDLVRCPACALVQITETIPPDLLFRNYVYFSSFSDTTLREAERLARRSVASRGLGAGSLVVEAASNDGYLLRWYRAQGIPVLGVEPARNVAAAAEREHGIPTLPEFFSLALARRLAAEGRRADLFHANNVLAHVADLGDFVAGIAALLTPRGRALIEVPYLKDLVDRLEFDTVYHEHLCYFSLTALDRLFARHGLRLTEVERLAVHGGSLRVEAGLAAATGRGRSVDALLAEEAAWGVGEAAFYAGLGSRIAALKERLLGLLAGLRAQGKRIAAYGASAKGSTLMNCLGIDASLLDFVVDRSTVKQGRYTPGNHLPILPPSALLERQPDAVLLLTWNMADEILDQQREYRARGGRFILPLPEPRVL